MVSAVLVLTAVVGLLLYLAIKFLFGKKSAGPNPFQQDVCRPAEPLVTDQKMRDKVIKQGFSADKVPEIVDAIIIGSGIGGLTTAALLAKAGKNVLVLEQHDQAGGCCHTYIEKGYEFDIGIHYIGEMNTQTVTKTLVDQLTEGQLTWASLDDVYDVVVFDEEGKDRRRYPIPSGRESFVAALKKYFPHEHAAIDKFVDIMKACQGSSKNAILMKSLPLPLAKFLIWSGIAYLMTDSWMWNAKLASEAVEELTQNQELRDVICYCFGDFGTPPSQAGISMTATLHNHYVSGGSYPVGGASEIAFHIIPVIEKAGGKVLVRAPVTKILTDTKTGCVTGVLVKKMKEYVELRAPIVISNAGAHNTFSRLLPPSVSATSNLTPLLSKLGYGVGAMSVFVGIDAPLEELGDIKAQNHWVFTGNNISKLALDYLNLPLEEALDSPVPLLFISFPSVKDPTWKSRYPGKTTCVIITLAKYEWFEEWNNKQVKKRGDEYDVIKNTIGYKMLDQTYQLFPQIKDKIDYVSIGTPVSNNYYIGSPHGEIYGLDHSTERFSPEAQALLRPQTDIPGLYLTGQDVLSCGFTGALYGGLFAAGAVLGRSNIYGDITELHKRLYPKHPPRNKH